MNTMEAFLRGQANRGKEAMVFDWDKAATLIKDRNVSNASAGLRGDWEWTGGKIFENGNIVSIRDAYTYLSSTWAVPEIQIDGVRLPCFKMANDTPGWNQDTYWPDSARKIIQC